MDLLVLRGGFLFEKGPVDTRCVWSARHSACFARNVVISRLCRPWVCKGGQFVLIIDCRWPLLLPNIYSSLDIERGRASCPALPRLVCTCTSVCLWGQRANLRVGFRGLKDWRSGNRRKGWLHAILRVDGRRLCSILVRSPLSRIAEGHWNTFGSCQTVQNLSALAWKPPISHAKHNFRMPLTFNA